MSETTCPCFTPTREEFANFSRYITSLKETGSIGICKIIPPAGWFVRDYSLSCLQNLSFTPIKQFAGGKAGTYNISLFEKKNISLLKFHEFSKSVDYVEPDFQLREKKFWKTLGNSCDWPDPVYGADVPGTLFEGDEACGWNVDKLDSLLQLIAQSVPGVNTSYLYFGSWRALFAYHVEDCDLYSINYLHTGAPKSWYAVPPRDRARFESMATSYFPEDAHMCREFLRHKTKLFSPGQLRQHGIGYSTVLQAAGEIVVTFPGSYHAGFNHGFNIAESTNFATPQWIKVGRRARCCVCRPGSVRIDVLFLETLYLRHQRRRQIDHIKCSPDPPRFMADIPLEEPGEGTDTCRIRCMCGLDRRIPLSALELAPPLPVEQQPAARLRGRKIAAVEAQEGQGETALYQCNDCGLWSHTLCNSSAAISARLRSQEVMRLCPENAQCEAEAADEFELVLCYLCRMIELEARPKEGFSPAIPLPPPRESPLAASSSRRAETHSPQSSRKRSSQGPTEGSTLRRGGGGGDKCIRKAPATMSDVIEEYATAVTAAIGDAGGERPSKSSRLAKARSPYEGLIGREVWVLAEHSYTEYIRGIVTDTEGNMCRIHRRGNKRDSDYWVNMATDIQPSLAYPPPLSEQAEVVDKEQKEAAAEEANEEEEEEPEHLEEEETGEAETQEMCDEEVDSSSSSQSYAPSSSSQRLLIDSSTNGNEKERRPEALCATAYSCYRPVLLLDSRRPVRLFRSGCHHASSSPSGEVVNHEARGESGCQAALCASSMKSNLTSSRDLLQSMISLREALLTE